MANVVPQLQFLSSRSGTPISASPFWTPQYDIVSQSSSVILAPQHVHVLGHVSLGNSGNSSSQLSSLTGTPDRDSRVREECSTLVVGLIQ